jgi:hypothetical protein
MCLYVTALLHRTQQSSVYRKACIILGLLKDLGMRGDIHLFSRKRVAKWYFEEETYLYI